MKHVRTFTQFLFVALFAVSGPLFAATTDVVATIGEKKVTVEEFEKRYQEVRDKTLNPPPRGLFLEDLVRYELGVMEAEKQNLRNDPLVAERIRQELYKGLVEKELGEKVNKINVSEKEMESYYKKNPELRTSHILIEVKPGANASERDIAKKRAEEILREVKGSKRPFEELVNLYTDDVATKKMGGDIGWQTSLTVVPEYYNTALKMKNGEVRGLVDTRFGFHIVKLTGINPYKEANKRQIRAAVFDQKRKELFDDYFEKLKSKTKVSLKKSLVE